MDGSKTGVSEKLLSIEEEAAACRARFAKSKVGDWAILIHHDCLVEQLDEPAENRIAYILSDKPKDERAVRLHWMRPIERRDALAYKAQRKSLYDAYEAQRKPLDDAYKAQRKPLDDAYKAQRKPLYDAYLAQRKPLDDAYEAQRKPLYDAYKAQRKPLDDAYEAQRKPLYDAFIAKYAPGCPWDGKTLAGINS